MVRFKTLQNATLIAIAVVFAFLLISTFQNNKKSHDNSQSNPKVQGQDRNSSGEKPGLSPQGGGKQEVSKPDDLTALHWTAMSNGTPLPPGSIQGGYDSFQNRQPTLLYICRAEMLGAVWPGKAFGGGCNIGWDGREFVLNSYEILVGSGTRWGPSRPGFAGALVGGTGIHKEEVYICHVEFQNYGLQVGRAVGDTCNIGWGGKEYAMPQPFEVLYPPGVSPPRATTDTTGAQNAPPSPQQAQDAGKLAATGSNTSLAPATKPAQNWKAVYRVACGGRGAGFFSGDNYFEGGSVSGTSNRIATYAVPDPPPYQLYQSERYGNFAYHFPGLRPRAPFEVGLHFAEIYFNTGAVGSRVFNVFVNSREVLHHFDILAASGARDRAIVETFTTNADDFGTIVIRFETVVNNAKCSAIEVLDMDTARGSPSPSLGARGGTPIRAETQVDPRTAGREVVAKTVALPEIWKSATTGKEYRVKINGDLLTAEWINFAPQALNQGGSIRSECRRRGTQWIGTSRVLLPCTLPGGKTKMCPLLLRFEVLDISPERITGGGEIVRSFDCASCGVRNAGWGTFIWAPEH